MTFEEQHLHQQLGREAAAATKQQDWAGLDRLLANGFDLSSTDKNGHDLAWYAGKDFDLDRLRELLRRGAPFASAISGAFRSGARCSDLPAEELFAMGRLIRGISGEQANSTLAAEALFHALAEENLPLAEAAMTLDPRAALSASTQRNAMPGLFGICFCRMHSPSEFVRRIASGMDELPRDSCGKNLIHVTAETGNAAAFSNIREILGVERWTRMLREVDSRGESPSFACASRGHANLLALLLEDGADPEAADARGTTSLYAAAAMGHFDCARLLLDAGADPSRRIGKRGNGKSPVRLVRSARLEATARGRLLPHFEEAILLAESAPVLRTRESVNQL